MVLAKNTTAPAEVKAEVDGGGTAVVAGRKIRCPFDFVGIQVCPFKVGVSKNWGGPPKWMVKIRESPYSKWMIWKYIPLFLETPFSERD